MEPIYLPPELAGRLSDTLGVLAVTKGELPLPTEVESGLLFPEPVPFYAEGRKFSCKVYPVLYQNEDTCGWFPTMALTQVRDLAVRELFARWDRAGYNSHRAKDPYRCRAFARYLEQSDYGANDFLICVECFEEGEQP